MSSALCRVCGMTACFVLWVAGMPVAEALTVQVVPAISDTYIQADATPAQDAGAISLRIVAAPDQFEPASFVVYADELIPQLQVSVSELRDMQGNRLSGARADIRVVKRWYQRNFGFDTDQSDPRTRFLVPELLLYDDALVRVQDGQNYLRLESGDYINVSTPGKLNGFGTPRPEDFAVRDAKVLQPVDIAAGENRQFWLTIYVPPDALPGRYVAEVILQSGQQRLASVPLELEVLPFRLSKPRIEYSIYYRGVLSNAWPEGSVSSEFKSEAQMLSDFRNLHEHGINNPTVYQPLFSGALDKVLELRQQAGLSADKLYYLGVDIAPAANVAKPEEYLALLPGKIDTARSSAAAFGIQDVYFYARDEARDGQLVEQIPYWDAVRSAGGRVMAAGWRSESSRPGNFAATGGNEDLFNALGMPSRIESDQWHSKGKLIYSYQNPTGGEELPATWRRNYGLLLWQYDYDGAMPYAWQHSYGDAWNDFDHAQYRDHNFTYPTVDGAIDTLQWEGLRAAVDDSRYLSTLLESLDSARGRASPHAAEVRQWLRELQDMPLARLDLSLIREQMIGHILALQGFVSPAQTTAIEDSVPQAQPASADTPATARDADFRIENLQLGSILADGTAVISWHTSARATSRVEIVDKATRSSRLFESGALDTMHSMTVVDLKPGRTYQFNATSVAADGRSIVKSGIVNTGVAIRADSREVSISAAKVGIESSVASNYRASIGIDWQKSLRGWWRFSADRDAGVDISGRNAVATLESGAVPGDGWFGRGVRLNGRGAYIGAQVSVKRNGRATIEGWFRFNSFAMDNKAGMGILSGLYQHEGNNQFYFNNTNDYFAAASLLTVGTWHHIALSWDGDAGSALLYIDGQQLRPFLQGTVDSVESIDGLRIGDNTGFLGKLMQRSGGTFDGDVDEVRVWDRVLSPEEIRAAYDAGNTRLRVEFAMPSGGAPEWSVIGANAADQIIRE